ncbi:MAG: hypothetical protein LUG12_00160 [Erysipelotrichaceae bacterium]|nr:hypothetical protein [Erysipelotrichaceae bacterium]
MYNVESELRKWRKMKEKEEKILRENGMSEESIKILHDYDWDIFKAERTYKERECINNIIVENAVTTMELPVNNLDDILSQLSNEELFKAMKKINHKLTMQIIYLRICDYTAKEIALELDMSVNSVYYYIKTVRKKLKKLK